MGGKVIDHDIDWGQKTSAHKREAGKRKMREKKQAFETLENGKKKEHAIYRG